MKLKKANKILSALAQETRIQIFKLLVQEGPEGLAAGNIAEILQVPAATLSFHLGQLAEAGILKTRKEGRTIYYSTKRKALKELIAYLTENAYKKNKAAS